ncbi:MAG: response regulator transcription factor [bacterium]
MEYKASILYVEDDVTLSFVTRDNLERKGYFIDLCGDGLAALEKIAERKYDLCILDVMLPKMDGFTVASRIREKDGTVPILFLTARTTREDKIHGLTIGGDDYITKPFSIEELILKIEIFLKRSIVNPAKDARSAIHCLGSFEFDVANQSLKRGNQVQQLTYRESVLLTLLLDYKDTILPREEILLKVWGNDHFFSSRSLDVFISRLRKLLKTDPDIRIENIHNVGYRLRSG